ncbi:hypothetical protein CLU79DRAFT_835628 [Phycomyces nitens]|nr:hypothetical protein CLU79DRAFT_835628 [Phycomyces nitens]
MTSTAIRLASQTLRLSTAFLDLLFIVVSFTCPLLSTLLVLDRPPSRPSARYMDSIAFRVHSNDEGDSVESVHSDKNMTEISTGLNNGGVFEPTCAPWVGVPFAVAFRDSQQGLPRDYPRSCASLETQDTCFAERHRFPAVKHLQNDACCRQVLGRLGDNGRATKGQMACTPVRQDDLLGQGPWLTFIEREREAKRLDRAFLWETKDDASMQEMFGDVVSSETSLPEPVARSSDLVSTIGHEDEHSDASCEASALSLRATCPSSPSSFGEGIIDASWYSYMSVDELSVFEQKVSEDEIVDLASLFESLSIDDVSDHLSSDQMSVVDDVPFVDVYPITVQQVGVVGEEVASGVISFFGGGNTAEFDLVPQCTESVGDLFVFEQGESMDIESSSGAHIEQMDTDFEDDDFDYEMSVISEVEPFEMECIEYDDVIGAGFSTTGPCQYIHDVDVEVVEDVEYDDDDEDDEDQDPVVTYQDLVASCDGLLVDLLTDDEDEDDEGQDPVVTYQDLVASCDGLLADLLTDDEDEDDVEADPGVEGNLDFC